MHASRGPHPGRELAGNDRGEGELRSPRTLTDKLTHWANARRRALAMGNWLSATALAHEPATWVIPGEEKLRLGAASKLGECGSYLIMRRYVSEQHTARLYSARFCKQHLLCPFCAIRRGAKQIGAYSQKIGVLTGVEYLDAINWDQTQYRPVMITLTVKNGSNLSERFEHLRKAWRGCLDARKNDARRSTASTFLSMVEGGVAAFEVTRSDAGWHPHCHVFALLPRGGYIPQQRISDEWHRRTGDSYIVDIRQVHGQSVAKSLSEIFKYALKFSSMSFADTWLAARELRGRRLVAPFGNLWGVKVPDDLSEDQLDEAYEELLYEFIGGSYQQRPLGSPVPVPSNASPIQTIPVGP
jgi:hypothetical protein